MIPHMEVSMKELHLSSSSKNFWYQCLVKFVEEIGNMHDNIIIMHKKDFDKLVKNAPLAKLADALDLKSKV